MFRLNHIGLTYSNVDQQAERLGIQPLDHGTFKDRLRTHLFNIQTRRPTHILVAQEHHQDGSFHYHCYVHWLSGGRRVNADFFDLDGLHPSIEQLRNPHAWRQYIAKDDDPLEWIEVIDLESDHGYSSE